MKKSIIYLGLAVTLFGNVAMATANTPIAINASAITNTVNATPLAVAIAKGDVASVKKFIEYGADINEKSNGMTPLMIAARFNQVEIIKVLLENGAKIKEKSEKGYTALKYAEMSNAAEAAAALKLAMNA